MTISWQRAGAEKSMESMHSTALKLVTGKQADQVGNHQDGNHDGDHLKQWIGEQRGPAKISRAPFSPIRETDHGQGGNKEQNGECERHAILARLNADPASGHADRAQPRQVFAGPSYHLIVPLEDRRSIAIPWVSGTGHLSLVVTQGR